MRQKKERRAPEHNRDAPIGRSAWTCKPAAETQSVECTAVIGSFNLKHRGKNIKRFTFSIY